MFFLFKNPKTPEELAKICKNPKRLASWLRRRVWYVSDDKKHGYDKWQTPKLTLKDRSGDCDDFSILAKATLEYMGFKPFLLAVYTWDSYKSWLGKGHLVTVFYWKNRYWHISNWGLKKSIESSSEVKMTNKVYDEIAATVYKNFKKWSLYNENKSLVEKDGRVVTSGYEPFG